MLLQNTAAGQVAAPVLGSHPGKSIRSYPKAAKPLGGLRMAPNRREAANPVRALSILAQILSRSAQKHILKNSCLEFPGQ
eukprot:1158028-Pelagomonas_calceolata.AAC.6